MNRETPTLYMPDGRPAPFVMTADEAATLLRLESSDPAESLLYYRNKGMLRAVQIGRRVLYTLPEILRFLERQTEAETR